MSGFTVTADPSTDAQAEVTFPAARPGPKLRAGAPTVGRAGDLPKWRRHAPLPAAEIREASEAGASDDELAVRYGADRTTISRIVRGVTQPEAGGPVRVTAQPGRPALLPPGPVATLSVQLPQVVVKQIDAARGAESRSAWLRRAAEERLGPKIRRSDELTTIDTTSPENVQRAALLFAAALLLEVAAPKHDTFPNRTWEDAIAAMERWAG